MEPGGTVPSPTLERKGKFSAFSRMFKPWKWSKKKKTNEKIEKQVASMY